MCRRSLASKPLILLLALFVLTAAKPGAQVSAQADLGRLLRGPIVQKGLPFFPPNAIPSLEGEYSLGQVQVRVWSCRSPIVFSQEWQILPRADSAEPSLRLLSKGGVAVLAMSAQGYTLFLQCAEWNPRIRRFAISLEKRFRPFFLNAASDSELSFPAFVDFKP